LITPRSAVGSLPFVTSFNQGEGDMYAVQGTAVQSGQWNDLSAQDVLPTWYCLQSGSLSATPAYPSAASQDAFNGGSSLRLAGTGPSQMALYAARIAVGASTLPVLSFVSKTASGPLPYAEISYSDGTSQRVQAASAGPGWQQTSAVLGTAPGKTIIRIAIGFPAGAGAVSTVLGQLRIYPQGSDTMIPVFRISNPVTPVLSWSAPPAPRVAYWNVYQLTTAGCLRFLGPSLATRYDVSQPMFSRASGVNNYLIQPVTSAGALQQISGTCPAGG
jgi:hypothetical protein